MNGCEKVIHWPFSLSIYWLIFLPKVYKWPLISSCLTYHLKSNSLPFHPLPMVMDKVIEIFDNLLQWYCLEYIMIFDDLKVKCREKNKYLWPLLFEYYSALNSGSPLITFLVIQILLSYFSFSFFSLLVFIK